MNGYACEHGVDLTDYCEECWEGWEEIGTEYLGDPESSLRDYPVYAEMEAWDLQWAEEVQ